MGFFDLFRGKRRFTLDGDEDLVVLKDLAAEVSYRKLAFMAAVNLIAGTVSKCEVKTFVDGEALRKNEWYLWNMEPNVNQSAAEFWKGIITALYRDNEALVVEAGGGLLLADSFLHDEYAVRPDWFTNVDVRGLTLSRNYPASDVLYWTLGDESVKQVLDLIYMSYGTMISYSIDAQKRARGRRGVLSVDASQSGVTGWKEKYDKLVNTDMAEFMKADTAVLPIFNGMSYEELEPKRLSAGAQNTRDTRALVNDIFDFTAAAFGIPPSLLRGEKLETGELFDQFIGLTIEPLCRMLEQEINRKRLTRAQYLAGTRIRFDTSRIRYIAPLSAAQNAEKLIGSSVATPDEVRELVGLERTGLAEMGVFQRTKNNEGLTDN